MKINTILSVFAPKDTKFFPLLNETASVLYHASDLLVELLSSEDKSRRGELCKAIKHEETTGDRITGNIFKALNDTFITPFDREDIDSLTDEMDDAIDAINRTAQKVLLYSPQQLPDSTVLLAEVVRDEAALVMQGVGKLTNINKNAQEIRKLVKDIKRLEEKADVIYEEGIMELFSGGTDPVEIIKLKEIIQELERSANKLNKVGKVIKTVIVKYA